VNTERQWKYPVVFFLPVFFFDLPDSKKKGTIIYDHKKRLIREGQPRFIRRLI